MATTATEEKPDNKPEKLWLIILAGGKTDQETFRQKGISIKSLLSYKGRLLGDIALDAALQTQKYFANQNSEIEMYGNKYLLSKHFEGRLKDANGIIIGTPDNANLSEVFEKAIKEKDDNDRIIFIASDLPFLDGDSINKLIEESAGNGIYYPVINEEDVPICFRKMKTFKKLNNIRYAGGNVIVGRARDFKKASPYAKKLIAHKKNPIKMAQVLGLQVLFGLLSGVWGPKQLAQKITSKTGIGLHPFLTYDWRLAIDVDGWKDLQILEGGSKIANK